MPVSQVLIEQFGETGPKYPQIMYRDTWKVIQSLQLLVSHQMRSYSSVIVLCGSSYTYFIGIWVLGKFRETGPEYPKSRTGTHEKWSKIFSFLFHIKWDFTLVRVELYLFSQVLGYCGNLGKLSPNTPNHAQRHTKSNPKTSAPHLKSNEVLLSCQGHLRFQLYLSYGYSSIRAI